jgi:hypothetical protein
VLFRSPTYASSSNTIQQNVITQDRRFDVHGSHHPNSAPLRGNVVRLNCIWSPGAKTASGAGFTLKANRKAHVRVVKVNGTYRLAPGSPCRSYRPLP